MLATCGHSILFLPMLATCGRGYFSTTGLEPCHPCPVNTYQSQENQTSCTPCQENVCTKGQAAKSIQDCIGMLIDHVVFRKLSM